MTQPSNLNPEILLAQTDWLRFLARQLLSDPQAQEDLVQDTYLQTLRQPPTDLEKTRPFMSRVMKRLAARSGQRANKRLEIESVAEVRSGESTPEELVQKVTMQRDLVNALLAMPTPQRTVLLLRFYEDLGPSEIAKRLEIPLATAKSRQQRGLQELRDTLTRQYGDEAGMHRALAPLAALATSKTTRTIASTSSIWFAAKALVATFIVVTAGVWLFGEFSAHDDSNIELADTSVAPSSQADSDLLSPRRSAQETANNIGTTPPANKTPAAVAKQKDALLRVVDASGQGVGGVSVAITATALKEERVAWRSSSVPETGAADVLKGLDLIRAENTCEIHRVTFGFPLQNAPMIPLSVRTGIKSPQTLKLPPTGAVHLELKHKDGTPFTEKITVQCGGAPASHQASETSILTNYKKTTSGSAIEIPHVGLGLDLIVQLIDPKGHRQLVEVRMVGPIKAGEVLKQVVFMPPNAPLIRGRLISPDQVDLAHKSMQLVIGGDPDSESKPKDPWQGYVSMPDIIDLTMDAKGRFEFYWHDASKVGTKHTFVFGEEVTNKLHSNGLQSRKVITKKSQDGVINLGDIALTQDKLVAIGRVIDDAGNPVGGVNISLREPTETPSPFGGTNQSSKQVAFAISGQDGKFELRGILPSSDLNIHAWVAGHVRQSGLDFDKSKSPFEFTMPRTGTIRGSILLEDPIDAWTLSIQSAHDTTQKLGNRMYSFRKSSFPVTIMDDGIRGDGSFELKDLEPGIRDVQIRVAGRVVASIEGIKVGPGEIVTPVKLQNIKLEERPRVVQLLLRDEQGLPLAGKKLYTLRVRHGRVSTQTSVVKYPLDQQGSLLFTDLRPNSKFIDFMVKGFEPLRAEITGEVMTLNLKSGPRLHVKILLDEIEIPKDHSLKLIVSRSPRGQRNGSRLSRLSLNLSYEQSISSGETTVALSSPGDFFAELRTFANGSRRGVVVPGFKRRAIKVEAGDQSIELIKE